MISIARKILVVIAALVLGGVIGWTVGSLIAEETMVAVVKYAVLTGMAVVLIDATRRAWLWWRVGTFSDRSAVSNMSIDTLNPAPVLVAGVLFGAVDRRQ